MTHTTVGGTGTVDQVGWAKLMAALGVRFRVADPSYWAPTVVAGVDRTIRLSTGSAEACGVLDTTDTTYDLQSAANGTSSDRYDRIVATWTWSGGGCSVAFSIIQGTAGAGIPSASGLVRNPGATYQAVVAVAKVRPSVGTFAAGDVTDLRVWGGGAGPLVTNATSAFWHLIDLPPGGRLNVSGVTWRLDSGTWKVAELVDFTSIAARNAAFPAPYRGLTCTVNGVTHTHNGTKWCFTLHFKVTAVVTNASGIYNHPHGAGQTPEAWTISPTAQATDQLNTIIICHASGENSTNLTARFTRSDTNDYLFSNTVSFSAEARF